MERAQLRMAYTSVPEGWTRTRGYPGLFRLRTGLRRASAAAPARFDVKQGPALSHWYAGPDVGDEVHGSFRKEGGEPRRGGRRRRGVHGARAQRIEELRHLTALPSARMFEATYGAMLGGFLRYVASARGEAWAVLKRVTVVCAVCRSARAKRACYPASPRSRAGRRRQAGARSPTTCPRAHRPRGRSVRSSSSSPPTSATARASCVRSRRRRRPVRLGRQSRAGRVRPPCAAGGGRQGGPSGGPATQAETPEPAPQRTPPPAIGGEGAGWEWVNWVRAGLRDGSVPVNAAGAWLHDI